MIVNTFCQNIFPTVTNFSATNVHFSTPPRWRCDAPPLYHFSVWKCTLIEYDILDTCRPAVGCHCVRFIGHIKKHFTAVFTTFMLLWYVTTFVLFSCHFCALYCVVVGCFGAVSAAHVAGMKKGHKTVLVLCPVISHLYTWFNLLFLDIIGYTRRRRLPRTNMACNTR